MIIYNVTINVSEEVHDEWLTWMKQEHIPQMLDTGKFLNAMMTKVLVQEPMGGVTYSVQYKAESKAMLERYYQEDAENLRAQSQRFKDKTVFFRTELEVISEQ
ncbi:MULTISPECIES: DUF4286 family protein [Mesonia]|jgi:hypothetical protein|uniref:DUF4286 family protein n=1 Tax=Mesonia TaxID=232115 RepID=UPI0017765B8C|nr:MULTISPECIES: DUF4286 family protein [Mesonia]HIB36827.1 DUF4286 family protein [Mesonia sp.]HIO26450.1 DUF4286 family protein [Flavobacteriaceae bacterium]|tara:strand:+ start:227 stop:535 length:309 start_codon:yes stop_codon:yes gene_type:complete